MKCGGARGEITEKPPAREAIEARGNFGFEAEARDREKRVTIGEARIDEARLAVEEKDECTSDGAVDTQVAAEAIAGAARNETERSGGASEDAGDLIERAIATDGDDECHALVEGAHGECGGVTRSRGQGDAGVVRGRKRTHGGKRVGCAPGVRIDDEERFQTEIIFDRSGGDVTVKG